MHQNPERFSVTLGFHEILILFFVMVMLFTGLLFFGYRVGYTQNGNFKHFQPKAVAPAQQSPAVEVEPEIRMENSVPVRPPGSPAPLPDSPGDKQLKPVAEVRGEPALHPCAVEFRPAPAQESPSPANRMFRVLSEMARVSSPEGQSWGLQQVRNAKDADSGESGNQLPEPASSDCAPVRHWRTIPSLAC